MGEQNNTLSRREKDENRKYDIYHLKRKSPGAATLMSLIIPGLGQVYIGKIGRGIAIFIFSLTMWLILLGWVVWLFNIVDAYQVAKNENRITALELDIEGE